MKVLVIYNPNAGKGRAGKHFDEVKQAFEKHNIEAEFALTEYRGHGTELVSRADFSKYDGIVAAGGDGTLFEVINGYYQVDKKNWKPLGVLPVGTGNAFARDLEIDNTTWEEGIKIIAQNKSRKTDVGRFKTGNDEYYFLNILGLGFVADVTATANKLKFLGNVSYTLGIFYRTLTLHADKLTIELDGQKLDRDAMFVEISNTRYTANFLMAPVAETDDGLFDITVCGKMGRIKLLKSFPSILTGEHVKLEEIETYKASKIKIESSVPKVLTPDGELMGVTPLEVECLKQDVEMFWR